MSPFGPYDNFEDCISKNGDKSNPEAFCAWLENKITGQYPSEHSKAMPEECYQLYIKAYSEKLDATPGIKVIEAEKAANAFALEALKAAGWLYSRIGWVHNFAAPKMKTVLGVKVFATGEWTDSAGQKNSWKDADLDKMVEAFMAGVPGVVPLKAGHTQDSFNSAIAEKLGVPVELVMGGEGQGKGQVALGRCISLERKGSLLIAGFENVPEPVANLIESRMYSTVSCEIADKIDKFGPVLTAVALLGAEEPAVAKATLDRALVFGGKRTDTHVFTFSSEENAEFTKLEEEIKKGGGLRALFETISRLIKKHEAPNNPANDAPGNKEVPKEGNVDIKKLCQLLGLPETATEEEVLQAIAGMKQAVADAGAGMQKLQERLTALEHADRVAGYMESAKKFSALPGKPEEIAAELATLEEKAGKETAAKVLQTYQMAQEKAVAATQVIGSSKPGQKALDFETAVQKFQKDNPSKSRVDAIKATMKSNPDLYEAYKAENK